MNPSASIYVNRLGDMLRIAVTRNGALERLILERPDAKPRVGDIYRARVTKVAAGIGAAFLDLGNSQSGFLNRSELPKAMRPTEKATIEDILKPGRCLLVQVHREAEGDKLTRLTATIRLPGFAWIHLPNETRMHYSRDYKGERNLQPPGDGGWILRSGSEELGTETRLNEAKSLRKLFLQLQENTDIGPCERLWQADPIIRCTQDHWKWDLANIWLDQEDDYETLKKSVTHMPAVATLLKLHQDDYPLFDVFKISSQIEKALASKVWLKSGGWLHFRHTEALTVIDVNSGKNTANGKISAAQKTNLEAAEEIARQLRVRTLGGLVVIDFINARDRGWRNAIDKALRKAFSVDSAKTEILPISKLGLVELSRERSGPDLITRLNRICSECRGAGHVPRVEAIEIELIQQLLRELPGMSEEQIAIVCGAGLAARLQKRKTTLLKPLAQQFGVELWVRIDNDMDSWNWRINLEG